MIIPLQGGAYVIYVPFEKVFCVDCFPKLYLVLRKNCLANLKSLYGAESSCAKIDIKIVRDESLLTSS